MKIKNGVLSAVTNEDIVKGTFTIPDGVTSIYDGAFYGCKKLKSVTIHDGVTNIGYAAFSGCIGLTSVTIGNGVTSIGHAAFRHCHGLTSINVPDSVKYICNSAFEDCIGLTSVTIGSGVMVIGDFAFDGCFKLVEVYNKSSLTITKGSRGNGCVGYYAKNIYTDADERKLHTENGYIIYTDSDLISLIGYVGNKTDLVLPTNITEIYQFAFNGCKKLTSVLIPDGVTSIGDFAFDSCSRLTSVIIGNGVTNIGSSAFYHCRRLMSVTIGNNVTSISKYAFGGCSELTSIVIPDSVMSIKYYAFTGCKLFVKGNYKAFEIDKDGTLSCLGKKYYIKGNNTVVGKLKLCANGIHYCTNLYEIFNYYGGEIDKDIVIYEIIPNKKEIIRDTKTSKCCTRSIKLKKKLSRKYIIKLLNGGKII